MRRDFPTEPQTARHYIWFDPVSPSRALTSTGAVLVSLGLSNSKPVPLWHGCACPASMASMASMALYNAVLLRCCRNGAISMDKDSPAFRMQIRRWAKPSRPYTWEIHGVEEPKCLARGSNEFPTRGGGEKSSAAHPDAGLGITGLGGPFWLSV